MELPLTWEKVLASGRLWTFASMPGSRAGGGAMPEPGSVATSHCCRRWPRGHASPCRARLAARRSRASSRPGYSDLGLSPVSPDGGATRIRGSTGIDPAPGLSLHPSPLQKPERLLAV